LPKKYRYFCDDVEHCRKSIVIFATMLNIAEKVSLFLRRC